MKIEFSEEEIRLMVIDWIIKTLPEIEGTAFTYGKLKTAGVLFEIFYDPTA